MREKKHLDSYELNVVTTVGVRFRNSCCYFCKGLHMHDQLTPPPPRLLQIVPRLLYANLSIFKVVVTAAHVEMWLQAFFTEVCFWWSNIQLKSLSSVNTDVHAVLITVIVQNNTGRTAFPPLTGSYFLSLTVQFPAPGLQALVEDATLC